MSWLGAWFGDLRTAGRSLARSPRFAIFTVAILATCIGTLATIFVAAQSVFLYRGAYSDPNRIVLMDLQVRLTEQGPAGPQAWSYPMLDLPHWVDLPLQAVGAYASRRVSLTSGETESGVSAEIVTSGYFGALGTGPVLGRAFTDGDDASDEGVAILSAELWRSQFAGDPAAIGKSVILNGRPIRIIGVMPPDFRALTGPADVLLSVRTGATLFSPALLGPEVRWLRVVARLREGENADQLREHLTPLAEAAEEAVASNLPYAVSVVPFDVARRNPQARTIVALLGATSLLLLLSAATNLAGLLLARSAGRLPDAAIRLAVGGSRWQVARVAMLEVLLLATGGGILGLLLTGGGSRLLAQVWPGQLLHGSWNIEAVDLAGVRLDGLSVAFVAVLSCVLAMAIGTLPALVATRADPVRHLRGGPTPRVGGARSLIRAMVASETAMAMILLVGAGLMIRTARQMSAVPTGFDPNGVIFFNVGLPSGSASAQDVAAFNDLFLDRLASLNGIHSAAATCAFPLGGHCMTGTIQGTDDRTWAEGSGPRVGIQFVTEGFFSTLGVPVLAGRTFETTDGGGSPPVAVLTRSAATSLFGTTNPLGHSVMLEGGVAAAGDGAATIIGVVENVRFGPPVEGAMPEVFLSQRQETGWSRYAVRASLGNAVAIAAVREMLASVEPSASLRNVMTAADIEAVSTVDQRTLMRALTAFGGLALLLAVMGVWAVVSQEAAERRYELGVRSALGASFSDLVTLSIRSGIIPGLIGIVAGVVVAATTSGLLRSFLFEVAPDDPKAFVISGGLLLVLVLGAALVPAVGAARTDPQGALRELARR